VHPIYLRLILNIFQFCVQGRFTPAHPGISWKCIRGRFTPGISWKCFGMQYFTLPHSFRRTPLESSNVTSSHLLDSTRLRRTPVDSTGLQRTPADSSGLQWTPADSSGLQWTPLDSGGLHWRWSYHVTYILYHMTCICACINLTSKSSFIYKQYKFIIIVTTEIFYTCNILY